MRNQWKRRASSFSNLKWNGMLQRDVLCIAYVSFFISRKNRPPTHPSTYFVKSAFFLTTLLFSFLLSAFVACASSVSVVIDRIDPAPTWLQQKTELHATVIFAEGEPEWKQKTLGCREQYRWKWKLPPGGTVNSAIPADDGTGSGWSAWSAEFTSTCAITFQLPGSKHVQLTVEIRLVDADDSPVKKFTARTDSLLEVIDLEDVTGLRIVESGYNYAVIEWDPSPNPNVAGYTYYLEPDKGKVTDVGTQTRVRLENLSSGTGYVIGVSVYDKFGNSTFRPLNPGP